MHARTALTCDARTRVATKHSAAGATCGGRARWHHCTQASSHTHEQVVRERRGVRDFGNRRNSLLLHRAPLRQRQQAAAQQGSPLTRLGAAACSYCYPIILLRTVEVKRVATAVAAMASAKGDCRAAEPSSRAAKQQRVSSSRPASGRRRAPVRAAATAQPAAAARAADPQAASLLALKEWAPTCAAIAAGEQTVSSTAAVTRRLGRCMRDVRAVARACCRCSPALHMHCWWLSGNHTSFPIQTPPPPPQILLRKGGIKEPTFTPAARQFLLLPTAFHTDAMVLALPLLDTLPCLLAAPVFLRNNSAKEANPAVGALCVQPAAEGLSA